MSDEIKSGNVIVRMPIGVIEAIDDLVKRNIYGSRADFVKAASRRYLREIGCLTIRRDVSVPIGKGLEECKECEILKQYENPDRIK